MDIVGAEDARRRARRKEVGGGDKGAKDAGYRGEEAKDILDAIERVVHDCGCALGRAGGAATSSERVGSRVCLRSAFDFRLAECVTFLDFGDVYWQ